MEWSGQQSSATPPGAQPGSQAPTGPIPVQPYPAGNPLQTQVAGFGQPSQQLAPAAAPAVTAQTSIHPIGMPQAVDALAGGVPAMAQAPAALQIDDNISDVNDAEWVNRAKRAIASTRGDPHRQVQLIQHLRSQYLKQRFGRTVHTDEA